MDSEILSEKQFWFMKNKGTKDALGLISNYIYKKLNSGICTIATFLDLAKAFDTVNHQILFDKLYDYGIRGNCLSLMVNYLKNRKQAVKINGTLSEDKTVSIGVPQGTILGPLLFIIYINDLLSLLPGKSITSYADDTVVVTTGVTWESARIKMNEYLNVVFQWLSVNQLSLNISKTVYITFGIYKKADLKISIFKLIIKMLRELIQQNTSESL